MFATVPHKLSPCSTLCVFLGYSLHHKGYQCLDVSSNQIIISRHVVFEESSFLFGETASLPSLDAFEFLDDFTNPVLTPIGTLFPACPSA